MNTIIAIAPCSPADAIAYMDEGETFAPALSALVDEMEGKTAHNDFEDEVLDAVWALLSDLRSCTADKKSAYTRLAVITGEAYGYDWYDYDGYLRSIYEGISDSAFVAALMWVEGALESL